MLLLKKKGYLKSDPLTLVKTVCILHMIPFPGAGHIVWAVVAGSTVSVEMANYNWPACATLFVVPITVLYSAVFPPHRSSISHV